jgi:2-oxoglutarate dehydrogenase E2 component (dihydrolipoamide succinyltransferase)
MPEGGDPDAEIEVIAWHTRPGEEVAEGDAICLLSVDGQHAEIASPTDGVVARLAVGVGAFVEGGATLAEIAARVEEAEPVAEEPEIDEDPLARLVSEIQPAAPREVEMASFLSPAVRRLVAEHGVDVGAIAGSGRDGRVTRDDVLAAINR